MPLNYNIKIYMYINVKEKSQKKEYVLYCLCGKEKTLSHVSQAH